MPVSGVKADLVARLEEQDALATDQTATEPVDPQVDSGGGSTAGATHGQAASTEESAAATSSSVLPVKRAVLDDEAAEQVKRIRTDSDAARAVPPAQAIDSAVPPQLSSGAAEPPKVGEESAITASVVAEAKVPTEALERAALGATREPATLAGSTSLREPGRPREQQDFATSEERQEQEGAEEEEEPPVYEFEPESESGRPADLYLDTVSQVTGPLEYLLSKGVRRKPDYFFFFFFSHARAVPASLDQSRRARL